MANSHNYSETEKVMKELYDYWCKKNQLKMYLLCRFIRNGLICKKDNPEYQAQHCPSKTISL